MLINISSTLIIFKYGTKIRINMQEKVLVTGAAGFVGASLVPKLLNFGYDVRALDLMIFGDYGLNSVREKCEIIKGDIRNEDTLKRSLDGIDYVIHLAAISNDPMGKLNPELTWGINFDGTVGLVRAARESGSKRFIYASSSSVYGIKDEPKVTEDLPLDPITIYSKSKAESERIVIGESKNDFVTTCIRPATVCGYSPRLRLDVIVNIFAYQALTSKEILVNGGTQTRPNIHIDDMTSLYAFLLKAPADVINGQIYNFGGNNHTAMELAEITKENIGEDVNIIQRPATTDSRSYAISSAKIRNHLSIMPKRSIGDAVSDLKLAFERGLVPDPHNIKYRNVEVMKKLNLT